MFIHVGGREVEQVQLFRYLGGYAQEGMAHGWDVHARIGQCRATFESLQKKVWSRVEISIKTKLRIYNCLIISCLLYGAEVWELTGFLVRIYLLPLLALPLLSLLLPLLPLTRQDRADHPSCSSPVTKQHHVFLTTSVDPRSRASSSAPSADDGCPAQPDGGWPGISLS